MLLIFGFACPYFIHFPSRLDRSRKGHCATWQKTINAYKTCMTFRRSAMAHDPTCRHCRLGRDCLESYKLHSTTSQYGRMCMMERMYLISSWPATTTLTPTPTQRRRHDRHFPPLCCLCNPYTNHYALCTSLCRIHIRHWRVVPSRRPPLPRQGCLWCVLALSHR